MYVVYVVCSMIPLVFLQVLEPFCPQENWLPEVELEVFQPTCSTPVLKTSQTELNSCPLPSESSSPSHKDLSCTASLTETEADTVPLTVVASSSLSDAESVLPPPPLSDCTSASEPSLVSVPPLSNSHSLSVEDDSFIPAQTRSDPPNSHPCVDVIAAAPVSEILSDESHCALIDPPVKIVISRNSLQKDEICSLQVPNSPCDTLV